MMTGSNSIRPGGGGRDSEGMRYSDSSAGRPETGASSRPFNRPAESLPAAAYGSQQCSVPDCHARHDAKGFCRSHYQRWRRHGDPLGGRTAVGIPRAYFEQTVLNHTGNECLIWPFTRGGRGYGQMTVRRRKVIVHREVCKRVHGPPPSAQHHAAHNCGKGHLGCVSPHHVRWATPLENSGDRVIHGTSWRGSKAKQAKLTADQVREIRILSQSNTHAAIARRFGVSETTIYRIIKRQNWAWLDDEQ